MYHSITFGDKNTWDDWHLVPSSRPVFNPPAPKTVYVDIPGSNGHIDLSEVVSGEVVYENRTGSFEFIVMNGYQEWHRLYSEIMNYLHGKTMRAVLEDDPIHYYVGRFSVNQWKSEAEHSKIVIDYTVYPYKLDSITSTDAWKWDDFNFETDIVRQYTDLPIPNIITPLEVTIVVSEMSVIPEITTSEDNVVVEYNGETYDLGLAGTTRKPELHLRSGEHVLKFTGSGTVSIYFRGGSL